MFRNLLKFSAPATSLQEEKGLPFFFFSSCPSCLRGEKVLIFVLVAALLRQVHLWLIGFEVPTGLW